MYLLDTCTLIWLSSDLSKLPKKIIDLVEGIPEQLFASSISAFEIGIKSGKKQLILPCDAKVWYEELLVHLQVQDLPVDAAIAMQSTQLKNIHTDPCDRIIVATAMLHDMTILSPDPLIKKFPDIKILW